MADQPPPPPPFVLVPSAVNGIIDYSTRQGIESYRANTKSLYNSSDDCFDVEAPGLQTFLSLLGLRASSAAWDMDVPMDLEEPLEDLSNLLQHHGEFTLTHLIEFAESYVNLPCRAAQMNMQIVNCVQNSLSLSGFRKIQVWHEQWHVGGTPAAVPLIKVIIREAYIDTQATARILREHLSSLPAKLAELKDDIPSFNAFVMTTLDQLRARGETTSDLTSNLFKGYLSCSDRTFVNYIEKKQEDYDEGTAFSHSELMNLAANKYKTLVQCGKWMARSPEELKILALEAKLSKFSNKKSGAEKSSNKSGNSKNANADKGKKEKKPFPEWMSKHPGATFIANGQSKKVDGKQYWWCPKHNRFVQHKPADCRLSGNAPPSTNTSHASANNASPNLRVSAALLMNE